MSGVDRLALYGSDRSPRRQREALTAGAVPVAVYGLGKMGLPLAAAYAETTGNVTGVDVDPDVVSSVNDGRSHVAGEPGLDSLVAREVDRGRLRATRDGTAAATRASIHVVIVPTLLTDANEPDLSTVDAVIDDVADGLARGDLVVVESTLPPGTCRDRLYPRLLDRSGLEPGTFGLAFCPERTSSGTALRDILGQYPKVVGGVDDESARVAALVYDELTDHEVHVVSDATTAESVKVFEGVYRDVNIALANELARVADDLDVSVREAIATANDIPQCDLHDPGPGVGGHCIPYYPHFLFAQTSEALRLPRTARHVNEEMPAFTVSLLESGLDDRGIDLADASVLVAGFTYRPDVAETRASPAIDVVDNLRARGSTVYGVDPLVDPSDYGARPVPVADVVAGRLEPALDAAVIVTPQSAFDAVDWDRFDPMVVVDARDALDVTETHHDVRTLGGSHDDHPRGSVDERDRDDAITESAAENASAVGDEAGGIRDDASGADAG